MGSVSEEVLSSCSIFQMSFGQDGVFSGHCHTVMPNRPIFNAMSLRVLVPPIGSSYSQSLGALGDSSLFLIYFMTLRRIMISQTLRIPHYLAYCERRYLRRLLSLPRVRRLSGPSVVAMRNGKDCLFDLLQCVTLNVDHFASSKRKGPPPQR